MNLLLNIIWLICGGFLICVEYIVSSLLLMITIVGIPFGFQTLKLSMLALCPFGREIRSCPGDGGCLSVLMNIIWILVGGIWISLSHLAFGVLLCITVIGIPFGLQHFKLAGLALTPFGNIYEWVLYTGYSFYPRKSGESGNGVRTSSGKEQLGSCEIHHEIIPFSSMAKTRIKGISCI